METRVVKRDSDLGVRSKRPYRVRAILHLWLAKRQYIVTQRLQGCREIAFEGWTEGRVDSDMSNLEQAIARYAGAERQLCDEAAPLLGEIIRGIEARCGLRISELRVTVDWANSVDGAIIANCTIVQAQEPDRPVQSKTLNGAADPARTQP